MKFNRLYSLGRRVRFQFIDFFFHPYFWQNHHCVLIVIWCKTFESNWNSIHLIFIHCMNSEWSFSKSVRLIWLTQSEYNFRLCAAALFSKGFFFICECVLIFVCIRFICRQCTRAMHITIQDDAVREKHLNKSKTNNKYKRPFVAKWLNSSGKRSTYYIQKISYRFLQFRFNAWKSASNASKFDTDWLI